MADITINGSVLDIEGAAAGETLRFAPRTITTDHLSERYVDVDSDPITGAFSVTLHPGPMKVSIGHRFWIFFTVPDSGGPYTLWSRIAANVGIPPDTPADVIVRVVSDILDGEVADRVAVALDDADVLTRPQADTIYATTAPTTAITYNPDGTVASVTENGITTTYTYNPDGSVATDTRLGVTRTYTYDGSGNLTGIAS